MSDTWCQTQLDARDRQRTPARRSNCENGQPSSASSTAAASASSSTPSTASGSRRSSRRSDGPDLRPRPSRSCSARRGGPAACPPSSARSRATSSGSRRARRQAAPRGSSFPPSALIRDGSENGSSLNAPVSPVRRPWPRATFPSQTHVGGTLDSRHLSLLRLDGEGAVGVVGLGGRARRAEDAEQPQLACRRCSRGNGRGVRAGGRTSRARSGGLLAVDVQRTLRPRGCRSPRRRCGSGRAHGPGGTRPMNWVTEPQPTSGVAPSTNWRPAVAVPFSTAVRSTTACARGRW